MYATKNMKKQQNLITVRQSVHLSEYSDHDKVGGARFNSWQGQEIFLFFRKILRLFLALSSLLFSG